MLCYAKNVQHTNLFQVKTEFHLLDNYDFIIMMMMMAVAGVSWWFFYEKVRTSTSFHFCYFFFHFERTVSITENNFTHHTLTKKGIKKCNTNK